MAWFGVPALHIGDWVYDVVDPRHVGRITMIESGLWARVQWRKDLTSDLPVRHLRKTVETGE